MLDSNRRHQCGAKWEASHPTHHALDPVLRSYHLMAEAMVNCFLQDVQRYRRLKMRRTRRIRSSTRIESADERRIELEFRAWMAWTRRKDDYFLSFDRCCDQLGVEPEWILDELEIGPEI